MIGDVDDLEKSFQAQCQITLIYYRQVIRVLSFVIPILVLAIIATIWLYKIKLWRLLKIHNLVQMEPVEAQNYRDAIFEQNKKTKLRKSMKRTKTKKELELEIDFVEDQFIHFELETDEGLMNDDDIQKFERQRQQLEKEKQEK